MNDTLLTVIGTLLPFLGTSLGAGTVFFLKASPSAKTRKCLYGFAAGVMLASLVWSLLIPSFELSPSPAPALIGFLSGMGLFILCDLLQSRLGFFSRLSTRKKLFFAVTLHNIPEGMAVGVAFAGALSSPSLSMGSAMVLSIGIALQNFPEGAIISTPLSATGFRKGKAASLGVLSGVVEPIGAVAALILTRFVSLLLPYVLSFAAGAMLFVVCDELIPSLEGEEKAAGLWSVALGFAIMMAMDVILG